MKYCQCNVYTAVLVHESRLAIPLSSIPKRPYVSTYSAFAYPSQTIFIINLVLPIPFTHLTNVLSSVTYHQIILPLLQVSMQDTYDVSV